MRAQQLTDPLVGAPTRESSGCGPRRRTNRRRPLRPADAAEGTRHDIVLPFDPIDARSAQIIDDVDDGAPADEAKEDRTRRRITTLVREGDRVERRR